MREWGEVMQEMTHRHTRELDVFYNKHRDACTNCGRRFQNGMCAHLGYDIERNPGTLAVADGVVGNALFLHTQGPFFCVGQLHAVDAGRPQLVVRQKFHQLFAAFFRPTLHVSPLPDVLGIKLADRHFLADGVDPVGNVLLYLPDLLTQRKVGALPGRDFVGGY